MEQQSLQMVLNYLDKIALKIGTTVEHVWPWLIRQQYVEAIYPFIISFVFGLVFILVLTFTVRHWDPDTEGGYNIYREDHEGIWIPITILLGIVFFIFLMAFLFEFGDIFNAEYHAFMKLLSIAK